MSNKTLREFIGNVKQGLARTSHFGVSFNRPKCLDGNTFTGDLIQKVHLFCEQTQLPSLNVNTTPIRTWGETREMPYDRTFDPVNFTFYVDKEMRVKLFFDQWISSIQDYKTRHMSFYEDFTVDVNVEVFDVSGTSRYRVSLKEAYPKTISAVEMNYGGKDVMRVQVTFAYRYWETNRLTSVSSASGVNQQSTSVVIPDSAVVPNKTFNASATDWQNTLKSLDLPQFF